MPHVRKSNHHDGVKTGNGLLPTDERKRWLENIIKNTTKSDNITAVATIQELWSGYGNIFRYRVSTLPTNFVIVKHVQPPIQGSKNHPTGWATDLSHQRKLRSYYVEIEFYKRFARLLGSGSRVANLLGAATNDETGEHVLILEDLDAAGYPGRCSRVTSDQLDACIRWLANFHATFLGLSPHHLWPIGTYWHLATRPDELQALNDASLKAAAEAIDAALTSSPFQTIVHGDAKVANFCFAEQTKTTSAAPGSAVAAVDFQYVGGGCGMKDLCYLVSSCLTERQSEEQESRVLDVYFDALRCALRERSATTDPDEVERNWRSLYHVAVADYVRFMKGWSPSHPRVNSYSEKVTRAVVQRLCGA